jgi:recombination protein RecA
VVLYQDYEHKLDPDYARAVGVDTDRLLISQPPYIERGFAVIDRAIKITAEKNTPLLVVIDSVNAAICHAEYKAEWDDITVGALPRALSTGLKKLAGMIGEKRVSILAISQLRDKIGGMGYGDNHDFGVGKAIKFYAAVIAELKRVGAVKSGDTVIGNRVKLKVTKNQVAPPFREGEYNLIFGSGVDPVASLLDLAKGMGIVGSKGGTIFFISSAGEEEKANGLAGMRERLSKEPDLLKALRTRVEEETAK